MPRSPAKSAGATLAPHVVCLANHAGVVGLQLRRVRVFWAVFVAWSWFRQSGVILSHPPVPRKGHNAHRWAADKKEKGKPHTCLLRIGKSSAYAGWYSGFIGLSELLEGALQSARSLALSRCSTPACSIWAFFWFC